MSSKQTPQPAVIFDHVSKEYLVRDSRPTLSTSFFGKTYAKHLVLDDISVTVEQGQKIGLVGPNGAGKTTLLKMIAGITHPTQGSVITTGKIVSLIALEAGFQEDLTGYDNIFLNGLLIGLSGREVRTMITSIIEYADLGEYIYRPFFTYSQGMRLRLAFAIAIHAESDILLMDESFLAADQKFRQKISREIKKLFSSKKTIFIAAHDHDFLEQHCRVFWQVDSKKIREVDRLE